MMTSKKRKEHNPYRIQFTIKLNDIMDMIEKGVKTELYVLTDTVYRTWVEGTIIDHLKECERLNKMTEHRRTMLFLWACNKMFVIATTSTTELEPSTRYNFFRTHYSLIVNRYLDDTLEELQNLNSPDFIRKLTGTSNG